MEPGTTTEKSEAVVAMQERKFRIPGDTVNKATAELPDRERSAIRWLHAHGAGLDLSLEEIGKALRYDASVIHRLFHGKYEGSLTNVVQEIESFRELWEQRNAGRKLDFVETAMARKIWKLCRAALEYQRIGFIFGETQIGKTEALWKFTLDNNHGSTIYVRMPTGGAIGPFLVELAKALRIGSQAMNREIVRRIKEAFDDRMLLIVDEAHQCLTSRTEHYGARSIEFVREIFDERKCGVIICATNVFRDQMESGRYQGILKQCRRRRLAALQLPATPTREDLDTFAAAYNLSPSTGEALTLQSEVIREEGLGMWLTLLRMAAKVATTKHARMSWGAVIRAHAGLKELEGVK